MIAVVDVVYLMVAVLATVALSFLAYLLTHRLAGIGAHDQHRDMANAMVTRIGALHGLILALVFAQEMASYQRLQQQVAQEASAVADVFNDAGRYGDEAGQPIRSLMVDYVQSVVDLEWNNLAIEQALSDEAWSAWEQAYEQVLDLGPQTPREASLRDHMLSSLHAISASRDMRENEAVSSFANLFWFAALSGVVLIAAGHYTFRAERHNLVLLALFSGYTGVILFLIYAFSNPYAPPFALSPSVLQSLLADLTIENGTS